MPKNIHTEGKDLGQVAAPEPEQDERQSPSLETIDPVVITYK